MVESLNELDLVARDNVDDSVFLSQTPRPNPRPVVFQRLWHADTAKRIANNRLDEIKGPDRQSAVRTDPVTQVIPELGVENHFAINGWSPLVARVARHLRSAT